MAANNQLTRHSLKGVKSISEAIDVYRRFILDMFPTTIDEYQIYRRYLWPVWHRRYTDEELETFCGYANQVVIPDELRALYQDHGGLVMEEGLNIDQPDELFRKTDFQTIVESYSFETEDIADKVTDYLKENYCHFATLDLGNRTVFAIFDKDGHGFNTIVQDGDDIFEEQFENLCKPLTERKTETLLEVLCDLLYQLMEQTTITHED